MTNKCLLSLLIKKLIIETNDCTEEELVDFFQLTSEIFKIRSFKNDSISTIYKNTAKHYLSNTNNKEKLYISRIIYYNGMLQPIDYELSRNYIKKDYDLISIRKFSLIFNILKDENRNIFLTEIFDILDIKYNIKK